MSLHPFAYVMIATFLAAVATMLLGVAGLSNPRKSLEAAEFSNKLMGIRVGLCVLLLGEIIFYITCIKP